MWLTSIILGLFSLVCIAGKCMNTIDDGKVSTICYGLTTNSINDVGIQSNVQVLSIEDAKFDYPVLHFENFTEFKDLEVIRIRRSKINKIYVNTFSGLGKLNFIDLSSNEISNIIPGAFNGISLSDLILDDNNGIALTDDTFRGSKVGHLYLRNCGLRQLNYATIRAGRIRNLTVSNNKIRTLDEEFLAMLQRTHLDSWGHLDISGNPLRCDCDLAWLSKFMAERERENTHTGFPLIGESTHELPFTCHEPSRLAGRRLPLDVETICPTPRIIGIDLDILQESPLLLNLVCKAKAMTAPTITMINGEGYEISSKDPDPREVVENGSLYFISRSQMNLTIADATSKLIKCVATNKKKSFANPDSIYNGMNSLSINLKTLIDQKKKSKSLEEKASTSPIIDPNYDNLFVKRYTLLELIGSIVGTFIGTLLFLYCISRCLPILFKASNMSKRSSSPENSEVYLKNSKSLLISHSNQNVLSKNSPDNLVSTTTDSSVFDQSQFQNTFNHMQKNPQYWPTPEYTYSTTNTGPEYDVPRVTSESTGPMSATLSRRGMLSNPAMIQSPMIIPNHLGQPTLYHPSLLNQAAAASPALLNAANFYNQFQATLQYPRPNNNAQNLLNSNVNPGGVDNQTLRNNSNSPSSGASSSNMK